MLVLVVGDDPWSPWLQPEYSPSTRDSEEDNYEEPLSCDTRASLVETPACCENPADDSSDGRPRSFTFESSSSSLSCTSSCWTSEDDVESCAADSVPSSWQPPPIEQDVMLPELVKIVVGEVNSTARKPLTTDTLRLAAALERLLELAMMRRRKHERVLLTNPDTVAVLASVLVKGWSTRIKNMVVSLLWVVASWTATRQRQAKGVVQAMLEGCTDLVSNLTQLCTSEAIGLLRFAVVHHPDSATFDATYTVSALIPFAKRSLDSTNTQVQARAAGLLWILGLRSTVLTRAAVGCTSQLVTALKHPTSKSLQENAAGALWSLSNDETTHIAMNQGDVVRALVDVAAHGHSALARDHATGALLNLAR